MSTVTPILDTLLPQVLGRRASLSRFTATHAQSPLLLIDRLPASGDGTNQARARPSETQHSETTGTQARHKAAEQLSTRITNNAPQLAGKTVSTPQTASAQLHFSREGQAIATLLSRYSTAPMSTSYTQGPLFSGTHTPAASVLAAVLGRQVAYSGVFYESHLQKWLKGQRSLKQLQQEPQGKLSSTKPGSTQASASSHGQAAARSTQSSGSLAPRAPSLLASLSQGSMIDPIHERALPIVRQQLDALSASVFRWQGMAWLGVPMHWEIHRHQQDPENPETSEEGDDTTPYSTRLKLELPNLGTLEVHIVLSANALQMYAWAGTDEGAAVLEPRAPELQKRLERAGFNTASVQFLAGDSDG